MAYPGIACVLIGITVGTILYYIFGNNERQSYENDHRHRGSNEYYTNDYDSGYHRGNMSYSSDIDDCPICLTSLATGGKVLLKSCKHGFHRHCIEQWRHNSHQCPTCRSYIE